MRKIYFLVCIVMTGNSFAQIYGTIQGASGNNNVGIGTGVPTANLDIYSTALSGSETLLKLKVSDGLEDYFKISNATLANSQFIPCLYGYHVTDNRQALYIIGEIGVNNDTGVEAIMAFDSRLSNSASVNRPLFSWESYGTKKMILNSNGNLGIGTTNPTSKLTVAGDINSREVKVTVNAGADFVFAEDYDLPSLDSVEKYIAANKHLPEIASAKEMQTNGINLSEMNIKLLQKIEEMTLYMIEQNKEIDIQEKHINSLSEEIVTLKKENKVIKTLSERILEIESKLE